MKLRKTVVISILVVLGVASAVAAISMYTGIAARASMPDFAGLSGIPSDYRFVFGVNVQKFTQSPAFSKFQQNNPAGSELFSFVEKTGLDPMRDITYLVGASGGKDKAPNRGLLIVSGVFKQDAIKEYIRSKAAVVEQSYAGVSIATMPESQAGAEPKGIAFLSGQELAMGELDSLKSMLDIRGAEDRSILYSETLGPLIRTIGPDEMFWFAGDASGLAATAAAAPRLASPLLASSSSIKSVVGSMNLGEALTGKITATAATQDQALKLVNAIRGLIAFGQLAGSKNPELKTIMDGFVVSQVSEQVQLDLNIPSDLLAKMGQHPLQR